MFVISHKIYKKFVYLMVDIPFLAEIKNNVLSNFYTTLIECR